MSNMLLKNIPEDVKKKLKEQADLNHRSVNKEAIFRLEKSLVSGAGISSLPPPFKAKIRFSSDWVTKAKKWGRH